MTKVHIYIESFRILMVSITLALIPKYKNSIKLLSSLEKKKDTIINLKTKNNDEV